jgi:hypothetical protein
MELTPDEKIPFDYNIIQVSNAYYKCGQADKANALVQKLADISTEKLNYYLDQDMEFISAVNDEILFNFQILQNLIGISKSNGQSELSDKIEAQTDSFYNTFASMTAGSR